MDKFDFLKKDDLFAGLSDKQLKVINAETEELIVPANQYLIREHEISDDIYIIEEGEVEILKEDAEHGGSHSLGVLGTGALIGEISLIDNAPRSASVRTTKETKLLVLSIQKLRSHVRRESLISKFINIPNLKTDKKGANPIYLTITQNIAKKLAQRLRTTNDLALDALKKDLQHEKARNAMSRFMISVLVLLSFYVIAMQFMAGLKASAATTSYINIPFMIFLVVPLLIMMKKSGYPMRVYGLTFKNWKIASLEAIVFTLPFLIIILAYKWVLITRAPEFLGRNLFDMSLSLTPAMKDVPITWSYGVVVIFLYLLFVPVQEILARGAMQSSFQILLTGKYKQFWAIILSNLLFSVMHTHVSLGFGLVVYIPGLFWGWLYSRHHTLVGVTLSHWILGAWAVFIVGLI